MVRKARRTTSRSRAGFTKNRQSSKKQNPSKNLRGHDTRSKRKTASSSTGTGTTSRRPRASLACSCKARRRYSLQIWKNHRTGGWKASYFAPFRTSKTKSASEDENIHQLMRFFLPVDNSSSENHSFFSGLGRIRAFLRGVEQIPWCRALINNLYRRYYRQRAYCIHHRGSRPFP